MERNYPQCDGKNCYPKHTADRVANATMRARNRKIRVYECQKCYFYHLTSEKKYKWER